MTDSKDTIVIGGGLSGLVAAHRLHTLDPDHSVLVIEKSDRFGGVIQSFTESGFHAELGPHGFLDNCIESRELLVESGLGWIPFYLERLDTRVNLGIAGALGPGQSAELPVAGCGGIPAGAGGAAVYNL